MADVDVAVRIRRTVVKNVMPAVLPLCLQIFIEPFLFPESEYLRLPLGKIGLHREAGLRQIQGILVILRHSSRLFLFSLLFFLGLPIGDYLLGQVARQFFVMGKFH